MRHPANEVRSPRDMPAIQQITYLGDDALPNEQVADQGGR